MYHGATEKVVLKRLVEATWVSVTFNQNTKHSSVRSEAWFHVPRKENHVVCTGALNVPCEVVPKNHPVRTKRREVNWQLADMIGCKTLKSKAVPPDQGAGGSPARCYAEHTSKKGQHALELRLGPPPNL